MASSPPTDPRSLPSPDTASIVEHAWSRIVRGDAEALTKKPSHSPRQQQQQIPIMSSGTAEPDKSQPRVSMLTNAELAMSAFDASGRNAYTSDDVADARVSDEAPAIGEEAADASKALVDAVESEVGNAVAADGTDASQNKPPKGILGDVVEPGFSRPIWRKPSIDPEGESQPQPLMGAVAWPALGEARNIKASETRKLKASGLKTLPPSYVMASSSIQEPVFKGSLPSGDGPNPQQGLKQKPSFRGGLAGSGRPAFQPIENGPSAFEHPGSDQSLKQNMHVRAKGNFPTNPPMDLERASHHGSFPNNTRKWRNNRDQGRGNYGWHHHGRGYENSGDMVTLLHEQRIGPRNMPRPHPLMNVNPAFYPVSSFQNGGMYYIPFGSPEFVPPYFPPITPVGGMMHGPDPLTLRSMLLEQIDYYFSIENLCRDVFLRTHMDEQGFVPVSVIARFNRIRRHSPNPMVILEALQQSAVVEVQHDRIRRRNDGGKWKLLPDQVYNGGPGQKSTALGISTKGENRKFERADQVPVPSTQEASIGIHAASAMSVESLHFRSDRTHGSSSPLVRAERGAQHRSYNPNLLNAQHGNEVSSQSGLSEPGVGRTGGNETMSTSPNFLQGGNSAKDREVDPQNQEILRDARNLESSYMVSEASVENKPTSWNNPEGFWMENNTYFMHGNFVQDGSLPSDSEFMLKSTQDQEEDCAEVNDRDVQRLINPAHAPFGSFIAVP